MIAPDDVGMLCCPHTRAPLQWQGELRDGQLWRGRLSSPSGPSWSVEGGWVELYKEVDVGKPDRFMRRFYDGVPFLHDAAVKVGLPFLQAGGRESSLRRFLVDRMQLDTLQGSDGQPAKVLEVSVGTGANLGPMHGRASGDVQWWGLDLSKGMLRLARRRIDRLGLDVRLVQGDAHRLPFADNSFDRVLHVGGINAFHDIRGALAEMARVAKPGTPIVVVDEQLDASRRAGLYRRATFKLVTFYDKDPRSPVDMVPDDAIDVRDEQASRFFYCLTFCMPVSPESKVRSSSL
ncbi:MAG: SAM-dependent methyltransferase [Kiritimatiellia bacterium]